MIFLVLYTQFPILLSALCLFLFLSIVCSYKNHTCKQTDRYIQYISSGADSAFKYLWKTAAGFPDNIRGN